MLKILGISFGEFTKVTYAKHNGRCEEVYQLKTKDLYRPEMIKQYQNMKELFLQWFPTLKFQANMYNLHSIGIKYRKNDDTLIEKIKIAGTLENKIGSLCKITSEYLPVGEIEQITVANFIKEVAEFVNGNRAQAKLFNDITEEDDDDTDDADNVHMFHINDLQPKGVTQ